ncbi:MAG TPA: single-stranded DNA-binding protein [Gryllotalpicola sp.]
MSVRVQQSLSGFVASDPQLTATSQGVPRFYARVGQEQSRRLDDGSFEKTGVEFTDLVLFGPAAERAYAQFRKGNAFLAEGQVREYEHGSGDGTVQLRTQFVAKRLGHDAARTSYTVDRGARPTGSPRRPPQPEPAAEAQAPVTSWPVAAIPQ